MKTTIRYRAALALLAGLAFASSAQAAAERDGNEWASWRGPEQDGVSRAKGLIDSWSKEDENLLWKVAIGGRSTPVVFDRRVYVLHLTGVDATRQEELVCLDADTGKILWKYAKDIFLTDIPEERVGWSAPVGDPDTGYVYIHGVQGIFTCLDKAGKVIWQHALTEEFGKISGFGGRTFTPIIDQDMVIVGFNNSGLGDHGKPATRFLAMDKMTGEIRWWHTPVQELLDTNYSCPVIANIGGQRLLIGGAGTGYVHAIKANTGERVWECRMGPGPVNASVVVSGDKVYASYSEENVTGHVVCIDGTGKGDVTETHVKWHKEDVTAGFSSPILHEGRLYYVENTGTMRCLDAETGENLWKLKVGRVSKGSPVWADGKIYYANVQGGFYVLQPGDKECKILSKLDLKAADGLSMDLTASVAVAYGRVYFITRENLYCLGKKDAKSEPIPLKWVADLGPGKGDPAFIQVLPAEIHIHKNETATFRAYAFDAKGQPLGEVKPAWSLAILKGELKDGTYTPDQKPPGQFGKVEATVGPVKGEARVRVMADLPINTDFEMIPEGMSPSSFVGATKVKFNVVKEDGGQVLKKLFDAKILHSKVYMTDWRNKNYTIQADVRGGKGDHGVPDIGLINSRYVFDLMGMQQKIRIVGWVPRPSRISKMQDFAWEPGVWYTLKCAIKYHDKGATIQGKAWKRGEPEPDQWTIEVDDPQPYREGSPGLAVYPLAEGYYDNVKVTPNK